MSAKILRFPLTMRTDETSHVRLADSGDAALFCPFMTLSWGLVAPSPAHLTFEARVSWSSASASSMRHPQ
jgi:hypothetical protein